MTSLRTRVLSLSAVPLAFLVLLLALALFLQGRNAAVSQQSQRLSQILTQTDDAVDLLDKASRSVLAFDRDHKDAQLGPYRAVVVALPQTLRRLNALVDEEPSDAGAAARYSRLMLAGFGVITEYLHDSQRREKAAETALVASPRVRSLSTAISVARADFGERERTATAQRLRGVTRQVTVLSFMLLGLCAFGIIVTVGFALRFGWRLTRRIERLAENARRLAEGEDVQPIAGSDEIARLDRVYREMMERTNRQHDMVMILQRALLPESLPVVAGVRLDAAYVPAFGEAEVGGDWYDVFPISERMLGISVGDVAGHGLRAATIMGQARQALRTASYANHDPATVLGYVNRVLCRAENEVLVTAFFATLDLRDGAMSYALAGHPAPMFVKTGGPVRTLRGRGFVLGVDSHAEYETHHTRVDVGSAMLFFTDGLVEANRDYLAGVEALRDAIETEYRNASHNIAQAIVARIFAQRRPRDDVALLFLGVTALGAATLAPQPMHWKFDASEERSARRVKRALLWQIGEMTDGPVDLTGAELVINELFGNLARHTPGPAEVTLEWRNDTAIVRVYDCGAPFVPPADNARVALLAEEGRGLFIVRSIAEHFSVEWTGEGNCVSAVLSLRGTRDGRHDARVVSLPRK